MHPIYYMLGLCFCVWVGYWGYDELETDYASFGFLALLLSVVLGISIGAMYWSQHGA